jgi:hypothetical protein
MACISRHTPGRALKLARAFETPSPGFPSLLRLALRRECEARVKTDGA